jgi:hypothetical protein
MKEQEKGEERKALAAARGCLFQAAARALGNGTLSDEQVIRVRLALKRARSDRSSGAAIAAATRLCAQLDHELSVHASSE